jgi:hypothetical protein
MDSKAFMEIVTLKKEIEQNFDLSSHGLEGIVIK